MDVCHQSENDTLWWISPLRASTGFGDVAFTGICIFKGGGAYDLGDKCPFASDDDPYDGVTVIGHMPLAAARAIAALAGSGGFVNDGNEHERPYCS